MQLHRDSSDGINIIRGFDATRVRVKEQYITIPCIVTVETIIAPWHAGSSTQLTITDLKPATATNPELILLGTGEHSRMPAVELVSAVNNAGIGFEWMDTAAACRTYNVLAHEGRAVALVLLAD